MRRFRGLSAKQERVLGLVAIGQDGGHHPATLEALERRGLVERHKETLGGRFPVVITHWSVPLAVHMEWCDFCAGWTESEAM